jgi:hypothetical protein
MIRRVLTIGVVLVPAVWARGAEDPQLALKLKHVDAYVEKARKDWNVPGMGVGIVVKDRLVHARGYGFRDYGKKLPFTPKTTVPICFDTPNDEQDGQWSVNFRTNPQGEIDQALVSLDEAEVAFTRRVPAEPAPSRRSVPTRGPTSPQPARSSRSCSRRTACSASSSPGSPFGRSFPGSRGGSG